MGLKMKKVKTLKVEIKAKDLRAIHDLLRVASNQANNVMHNWPNENTPQNRDGYRSWARAKRKADNLASQFIAAYRNADSGIDTEWRFD